jgi:hypothetical protein
VPSRDPAAHRLEVKRHIKVFGGEDGREDPSGVQNFSSCPAHPACQLNELI